MLAARDDGVGQGHEFQTRTLPDFVTSIRSIRIHFLNRGRHGKDRIQLGHLEQFQDARVRSGNNQPDASGLAADVMMDDHAQAGGIHVGNIGQVENLNCGDLNRGDVHRRRLLARHPTPAFAWDSNSFCRSTGAKEPCLSRAVKGPRKQKITVPGALPCLRSIVKA